MLRTAHHERALQVSHSSMNRYVVFNKDDIYNHTRTNIIWQYTVEIMKYVLKGPVIKSKFTLSI